MATILIIDDHATNREYLVTLLGYKGHRLVQAADGAAGLAITDAERPHLVIADILMPTMDGFEFVRQLRAMPSIATTPVLFYTAHYLAREVAALARECGVQHVLTKPAEPEEILRVVEAVLGEATWTQPPLPPVAEEFDQEHLRLMTDTLARKADELTVTNERLNALIELSLQLGSERDPERLLQSFCTSAREILGARYAAVAILSPKWTQSVRLVTSGLKPSEVEQLRETDLRQGVLDAILSDTRSFRLPDQASLPPGPPVPPVFPPCQAFLGVPILSPSRVYGWLCLGDRLGTSEFSLEDERLARILATMVGRIYENGSLYAELLNRTHSLEGEIRERERLETELRTSEARFRALIEHSWEALGLSGANGEVLYNSPAAERILGYEAEELRGQSAFDFVLAEDQELLHRAMSECLAHPERGVPVATRVRHKDGSHRDLEGVLTNWLHEPAIQAIVNNYRDVTERKAAEAELRYTQERLAQAVVAGKVGLWDWDLRTNKVFYSSEWKRNIGYADEEITDDLHEWRSRVHPVDLDRTIQTVQDCLEGVNSDYKMEFRFCHKDGSYRHILARGSKIVADGKPARLLGSQTDITEWKQLEQQLHQAQKMETVGQLAGGIAHDFNNMLAVVMGYGDLLLGRLPADDSLRMMVEEIVAAGKRAAALTRQLLVFSRKAIIEPRVIDLSEVVTEMAGMLRRVIGEDIQLNSISASDLGTVNADLSQVEQVFLNLAINARDAMPTGGRLTVELQNVELDETYANDHLEVRAGRYVLLAVTDTGCGMDETTQARIFEPFFTTKGERGTGLGLATVYGIVRQSGGHIAVYSEQGVGTTFKVYLPRTDEPSSRNRAFADDTLSQGTGTILLAEDDEAVRNLSRLILTECGYVVLEASNGSDALRLAAEQARPIELLITDVVMPQMSGRELARQLRTLQPDLKVLYLSGYTDDAVVRHGILQAEVSFLQKPFSPASLARKVKEVLAGA